MNITQIFFDSTFLSWLSWLGGVGLKTGLMLTQPYQVSCSRFELQLSLAIRIELSLIDVILLCNFYHIAFTLVLLEGLEYGINSFLRFFTLWREGHVCKFKSSSMEALFLKEQTNGISQFLAHNRLFRLNIIFITTFSMHHKLCVW